MCEFNAVCLDRLVGRTGRCLNRAIVRACTLEYYIMIHLNDPT